VAQKLTRLLKPEKPKIRGNRRLHGFHKKYAMVGTKQISVEQLRKVLGLESIRDAVRAHQTPPTETEFDGPMIR
jgi:hypothetical protein